MLSKANPKRLKNVQLGRQATLKKMLIGISSAMNQIHSAQFQDVFKEAACMIQG